MNSLLTAMWKELFRKEDIGEDDDFFSLGGDSLKAAWLAGRINREFKARVPITDKDTDGIPVSIPGQQDEGPAG